MRITLQNIVLLFITTILLLSTFSSFILCQTQQQQQQQQQDSSDVTERGFISVSDSTKVKVILECGAKFMNVQLIFNETVTPTFEDYIIVGTTENSEQCELKGGGQTKYIIEIPILNDPCGTQMIDKGAFENRIRIAQNKQIVLGGDELVTVRCLYGPPKIAGYEIPDLPRKTDQSLSSGRGGGISNGGQTGGERIRTVSGAAAGFPVGYVYLIVFIVLFLALLSLLCGCLYFFFKRRKVRLEKRTNLVIAVPPNAGGGDGGDMGKMRGGLMGHHLWWSSTSSSSSTGGGKNTTTISNDAPLLSHDYSGMLNSGGNSNRGEGLSVSTEYGGAGETGGTPSTISSSDGSPGHHQPYQSHKANQLYIQDPRGMLHRGFYPHGQQGRRLEETMRSQTITTVQNKSYTSTEWKQTAAKNGQSQLHQPDMSDGRPNNIHTSIVYAHVDGNAKTDKNSKKRQQPQQQQGHTPDSTRTHHTTVQIQEQQHDNPSSLSTLPSTSNWDGTMGQQPPAEIYIHPTRDDNGDSVSTLESGNTLTNRAPYAAHQHSSHPHYACTVDNNEGGSAAPVATEIHHHAGGVGLPAPLRNHNKNVRFVSGGHTDELDREWTEEYVKIVEELRGIGPRKMNEQEIGRWRHLLENDRNIQALIRRARTAEEFETLPSHPRYAKLFPAEKWNLIVHSLAQNTEFMRTLNSPVDNNIRESLHLHAPALSSTNPDEFRQDHHHQGSHEKNHQGQQQHHQHVSLVDSNGNYGTLAGSPQQKRRYSKKSEENGRGVSKQQISAAQDQQQQQQQQSSFSSNAPPLQAVLDQHQHQSQTQKELHAIHHHQQVHRHPVVSFQEGGGCGGQESGERLFTRDSYQRVVKQEMGMTDNKYYYYQQEEEEYDEAGEETTSQGAAYHHHHQHNIMEFSRERATTETMERVPQVMTESELTPTPPPPPPPTSSTSSSAAHPRRTQAEFIESPPPPPPPPLSVYVGGNHGKQTVLPHETTTPRHGIVNTYGHGSSTYDNWQNSPDEL